MTKSTKNQQIFVDWGIAMTEFTDFATFCINQQFVAYFFVDLNSTMTKSTKYYYIGIFFESFVIF